MGGRIRGLKDLMQYLSFNGSFGHVNVCIGDLGGKVVSVFLALFVCSNF